MEQREFTNAGALALGVWFVLTLRRGLLAASATDLLGRSARYNAKLRSARY